MVHHYYDHHSQQYRQQTLSQEEMIRRYVSHIPARHFKMIRYYGFLANRKRGNLLLKVYEELKMSAPSVPVCGAHQRIFEHRPVPMYFMR